MSYDGYDPEPQKGHGIIFWLFLAALFALAIYAMLVILLGQEGVNEALKAFIDVAQAIYRSLIGT